MIKRLAKMFIEKDEKRINIISGVSFELTKQNLKTKGK